MKKIKNKKSLYVMHSEKSNTNYFTDNAPNNISVNHPSKDIKGTLGQELNGKKVVVCVTASVACYKAIDLIRAFVRHGADVCVVMSKTVEKFMSKDYFLWASGNEVISELSGELEHVRVANYNTSDLIVVYPCTANTIGKFANGIDDTPVTSILSIALGSSIPIIIAPAMHEAMYYNTIIKSNIQKLENNGVKFSKPVLEEDKAKVAPVDLVLSQCISIILSHVPSVTPMESQGESTWNFFCKNDTDMLSNSGEKKLLSFFTKKRILISVGSTIEYIDPVRIISNTSSGKMGFSLINRALKHGLEVTIIKGVTQIDESFSKFSEQNKNRPQLIETRTTDQMDQAITNELNKKKFDIVMLAAAVSDFRPSLVSDKKIPTDNNSIDLKLLPTVKIVDKIKHIQKGTYLVAFKAEYRVGYQNLLSKSWQKLVQSRADLIIANDVGSGEPVIGSDSNKILALDRERNYYDFPLQGKNDVAENIFKLIHLKLCRNKMQ